MGRKFWKIAHRGASGYEPENTLSSFRKAIALRSDMIEMDIRLTKDGIPAVIHDASVDRTTNGHGPVRKFTLDRLEELDAGNGQRIMSMHQVLFDTWWRNSFLNLELKEKGMERELLRWIKAAIGDPADRDKINRIVVSAFDKPENEFPDSSRWADILWLKEEEPRLKIMLLAKDRKHIHRALEIVGAYEVFAIGISAETIKPIDVRIAHRGNLGLVFVWTANEPEEIERFKKIGVDGIFSDYPDRL